MRAHGLKWLFQCLRVLPMGWTWSFWVARKSHKHMAAPAGFPALRILAGAWSGSDLGQGCIALLYRDNLTVCGYDEEDVNRGLARMMSGLEQEGASLHAKVLGCIVDMKRKTLRPDPRRAWMVKGALGWAASGALLTAEQASVLVGGYMPLAMITHGDLIVLGAIYTFIARGFMTPRWAWPSGCYELKVMGGLIPLFVAPLSAPFDSCILTSDAPPHHGLGICHALAASHVAGSGRLEERWGYRPVELGDWAPQARAISTETALSDVCTCDDVGVAPRG